MSDQLYLDTARFGRMRLRARHAAGDFLRLCGEVGVSGPLEDLLRRGPPAWPEALRRRYPGLEDWGGVGALKASIRTLAAAGPDSEVLLAQRSSSLMRLAARALFGRCRRVLHTDLEWPGYLRLLEAERARTRGETVLLPAREAVFRDGISAAELVGHVREEYLRRGCDGLFLSAPSYEGIRFPVGELVRLLEPSSPPPFIVVDGSQGLGHLPTPAGGCDLFLAGGHKWLRAGLPLGVAVVPRPGPGVSDVMGEGEGTDDGLLGLCQRLERDATQAFGETVNISPLFTAAAAVAAALDDPGSDEGRFRARSANAGAVAAAAERTGWRPLVVDRPLRSGILLLESRDAEERSAPPDRLRARFQRRGVALTAYPGGRIRLSLPSSPLEEFDVGLIRESLGRRHRSRCRPGSPAGPPRSGIEINGQLSVRAWS